MIRVVLADDHPFVRSGIRNILQKTTDIIVVGEAENGQTALSLVDELNPDILIIDMEMPGVKGFEVAKELSDQGSTLPVLAVSAHEDRQYILGMLTQGAYGYLTKDEVPEILVKAVRGVARGERGWISRRVAARLALWLQAQLPERLGLSSLDQDMLRLFLNGSSNNEIAGEQRKNPKDVDNRLEQIVKAVRTVLGEQL